MATAFPDEEAERPRRHLSEIVAAIDELRHPSFAAVVDANAGWPAPDLRPSAAKRAVREHLHAIERGERAENAVLALGSLRISLIRARLGDGFVGIIDEPIQWLGTPEQARRAVQKKVQKFKEIKGRRERPNSTGRLLRQLYGAKLS